MKISYDIRRYFDRIFFIYPVKLGEIYPPICPVKLGEIWTPKNGQITWDWTGHTLALQSDGALWAWGSQSAAYGVLGLNDLTNRSSPVKVGTLNDWVGISVSSHSSFALRKN